MSRSIEESAQEVVYRVFNGKDGKQVGTAFLVHKKMLLTCTHVIALAQNASGLYDPVDPSQGVWVEMPAMCGDNEHRFKASILKSIATQAQRPDRDIAFLELPEAEAEYAVPPVAWCTCLPQRGMSVSAYGFQGEHCPDGGWPQGTLVGPNKHGWWQMDGSSLSGVPLKPGLSGSPVWDENSGTVIGMLAAAHSSEIFKFAFLIPFELINQSCPDARYLVIQLPNPEQLESALLKLNFAPQVRVFREHFNQSRGTALAFLLHGKSRHGQRILVRKLLKSIGLEKAHVLTVSYGSVQAPNLEAVYSELEEYKVLPPQRSPKQINARPFIRKLRLEDTVIRIQTGITVDSKAMRELIDDFWVPLAEAVNEANPSKRLILMIIDEGGRRPLWDLLNRGAENLNPVYPVELPHLDKFTADLLSDFIQDELCPLNMSLRPRVRSICQCLIEECDDGLPEAVFGALCEPFGLQWDNNLARVL